MTTPGDPNLRRPVLLLVGLSLLTIILLFSLHILLPRYSPINRVLFDLWASNVERHDVETSIERIVKYCNDNNYGNAVYSLRLYKVRSELLGRSRQDYLRVVSRIRRKIRTSSDVMSLPCDVARSEEDILYGLYDCNEGRDRLPLSGSSRKEELTRLAKECAWLREWDRVVQRGPPAYDIQIEQWKSDRVISGSEAEWILTIAAGFQEEASREIGNLRVPRTERMGENISGQ